MYRPKHFLLCLLAFFLALGHPAHAQSREKKSTLAKGPIPRLAYVDLDRELGGSAELLRGFGLRVDESRREANAPALCALALQLAYAEELAGKKAKAVTAIGILREAARIAEEKMSTEEAKAVILASGKVRSGEEIAAAMKESIASFGGRRGAGDFIAYVRIVNKCDRLLDIYVDGKYVGFLYADESSTFSTGNGTTAARVNDAFGNTVSETFFLEQEETFTWTIQP